MSETPFMAQRRKLQALRGKQTKTERTPAEDAADAAGPATKKKAKKKVSKKKTSASTSD